MSIAGGQGYSLLDVGSGRRLERFGERTTDRPAPQATGRQRTPGAWAAADLRFAADTGWTGATAARKPWTIELDDLRLELRPTASGQVGLFPEHLLNLPWLRAQIVGLDIGHAGPRPASRGAVDPSAGGPGDADADGEANGHAGPSTWPANRPAVLNLFAYTGLATLAVAAAGAAVVHVDAARSAVDWARRNALLSQLDSRPVKWIVDDAMAFVARELRRGHRYAGVVLDPPAWGHGARGRAWRLETRLADLLAGCASLLQATRGFCLVTVHTSGWEPADLAVLMADAFRRPADQIETGPLELQAESGSRLGLGAFARLAT